METYFTSMHIIDRETDSVHNQNLDHEDAQAYIVQITNEVTQDENIKRYKVKSETTEVIAMINKIFTNQRIEEGDKDVIAKRLLAQEIIVQTKIEHLGRKIKKGGLIQSFFIDGDGIYYFLISKIESNQYLDETELIRRAGLPYDKKALKSCLFLLNIDGEITDIYISDTNRDGTEYWYNGFLELDELTSDEDNTRKVFLVLSDTLGKELKNFESDFILLRNQLLGYFKTKSEFKYAEAMEYIFGNYVPQNDSISLESIKVKMKNRLETKNLDTHFNIEQNVITQRMWKVTRKLNDFSEISLNGHEAEIKNSIRSEERNGEKYIIIKTTNEETFKSFLWEE